MVLSLREISFSCAFYIYNRGLSLPLLYVMSSANTVLNEHVLADSFSLKSPFVLIQNQKSHSFSFRGNMHLLITLSAGTPVSLTGETIKSD